MSNRILNILRRIKGLEFFQRLVYFTHLVVSEPQVEADSGVGRQSFQCPLVFIHRIGVSTLVDERRTQVRANRRGFGMDFQESLIVGDCFRVMPCLLKLNGAPQHIHPRSGLSLGQTR